MTPAATALLALLAAALTAAAPATYDQRQDGDFNVRADVQNVVLLVALPQKMSVPSSMFDGLFKSLKPAGDSEVRERADVHLMEAFVEPSTPYRVEIGSGRFADGDGRAAEVVIAGRRRQVESADVSAEVDDEEPNKPVDAEGDGEELKLLGAAENCGPDHERDPASLTCRPRPLAQVQPQSIPVSS